MAFNCVMLACFVAVVLFQAHVSMGSPVIVEAAEAGPKLEGESKDASPTVPVTAANPKEEVQGVRTPELKEEDVTTFPELQEMMPEISVSVKISMPSRRPQGHPRFGPRPGALVFFEEAPEGAKPDGEQNKNEAEQEKKEGAVDQEKQEKGTEQEKETSAEKEGTLDKAKLAKAMEADARLVARNLLPAHELKYVKSTQSL